jgi:hypothetical protein
MCDRCKEPGIPTTRLSVDGTLRTLCRLCAYWLGHLHTVSRDD